MRPRLTAYSYFGTQNCYYGVPGRLRRSACMHRAVHLRLMAIKDWSHMVEKNELRIQGCYQSQCHTTMDVHEAPGKLITYCQDTPQLPAHASCLHACGIHCVTSVTGISAADLQLTVAVARVLTTSPLPLCDQLTSLLIMPAIHVRRSPSISYHKIKDAVKRVAKCFNTSKFPILLNPRHSFCHRSGENPLHMQKCHMKDLDLKQQQHFWKKHTCT